MEVGDGGLARLPADGAAMVGARRRDCLRAASFRSGFQKRSSSVRSGRPWVRHPARTRWAIAVDGTGKPGPGIRTGGYEATEVDAVVGVGFSNLPLVKLRHISPLSSGRCQVGLPATYAA